MAKKQTRRAVSLNRGVYEALKRAAEQQGISIAHFVENAVRAAGLDLPTTAHAAPADVQRAALRRVQKCAPRAEKQPSPRAERPRTEKPRTEKPRTEKQPPPPQRTEQSPPRAEKQPKDQPPQLRREGPIRRALGDDVADWAGEP